MRPCGSNLRCDQCLSTSFLKVSFDDACCVEFGNVFHKSDAWWKKECDVPCNVPASCSKNFSSSGKDNKQGIAE